MEFTIGDKKFVLKDKITGRDYMREADPAVAEGTETMIKLAISGTKTALDDILDLPYNQFLQFFNKIQQIEGLKLDFLEEE